MHLSREQMEKTIAKGGSVSFNGNVLTAVEQLPSQAELDRIAEAADTAAAPRRMAFPSVADVVAKVDAMKDEVHAKVDAATKEVQATVGAIESELHAKVDSLKEEVGAKVESLHQKLDDLLALLAK